jgi:CheY-like chemotaxis protein
VRLPARGAAASGQACRAAGAARADGAATVLVVDDDPQVREMLEVCLTRAGYAVVIAGDGAEAQTRLAEGPIDLVLTDVFMPECDGIELVRTAARHTPAPPIIAMSGGYGGLDMLKATSALGATTTIAKPFRPADLLRLVARTLDAGSSG